MKVTKDLEVYVGVHISKDRFNHSIYLDQKVYITNLLEQYRFQHLHVVSTPTDCNSQLHQQSNGTDQSFKEGFPYAQIIGSLQSAALTTRPDIAFAINNATEFKNYPTHANCNAMHRILRYLKAIANYCLVLGGNIDDCVLSGFSGANNYAADMADRKSQSRHG